MIFAFMLTPHLLFLRFSIRWKMMTVLCPWAVWPSLWPEFWRRLNSPWTSGSTWRILVLPAASMSKLCLGLVSHTYTFTQDVDSGWYCKNQPSCEEDFEILTAPKGPLWPQATVIRHMLQLSHPQPTLQSWELKFKCIIAPCDSFIHGHQILLNRAPWD